MAEAVLITVETGSGLDPLANSYVSCDDAVAFAANRGVTIAATTDAERDAVNVKLIKAMDWLTQFESQWQGSRAVALQPLAWPRECVNLYGDDWLKTEIPVELMRAQSQLVLEQVAGIVLQGTTSGYAVKREKVGPIETEYDTKIGVNVGSPTMPIVLNFLKPLLTRLGFRISVERG